MTVCTYKTNASLVNFVSNLNAIYYPKIEITNNRPLSVHRIDVTDIAKFAIKILGFEGHDLHVYVRDHVHNREAEYPADRVYFKKWDRKPGSTFMLPKNQMTLFIGMSEVKKGVENYMLSDDYLTPLFEEFTRDCTIPKTSTMTCLSRATSEELDNDMHLVVTKNILSSMNININKYDETSLQNHCINTKISPIEVADSLFRNTII